MYRSEELNVCFQDFNPLILDGQCLCTILKNVITLNYHLYLLDRLRLIPQLLKTNVTSVDVSTSLLGSHVGIPIGIAPSAYHGLYSHEAEIGTAQGE